MKKKLVGILLLLICLFSFSCSEYDENGYQKEKNKNYISNQEENTTVKNVILFIGDGMGANQVEVARRVLYENEKQFDLDKYEYKSMMETSCLNNYVTDSAAAATALATGVKTNYQRVGMDEEGNELRTILDYFFESGKATGVVTDQDVTDATPASFTAHALNRYLYKKDIIRNQIDGSMNVLFGYGAKDFFEYSDQIKEKGWDFVRNNRDFKNAKSAKLLATFSNTDNQAPKLYEMTEKAINILKQNKKGFFLMIEAGSIDSSCGSKDARDLAKNILMLDKSLRIALNFMRTNTQTIVIVLADHETGGLVIKDGSPDETWFTEATGYHTDVAVPVYAFGARSKMFDNKELENTDIFNIILSIVNFQ